MPHQAPFDMMEHWPYSKVGPPIPPADDQAPHPIPKAEPSHGGNSFWQLVSMILFFQSLPRAHDHRWGLERRLTRKSKALPSGSASSSPQWSSGTPADLLMPQQIPCLFHTSFYWHWWTRPLSSFTRGKNSPPTWRGQFIVFWQRTMASDLEVQTLIMAPSHSAANRPNACWRSQNDEAHRATSSAKHRRNSEVPKLNTLCIPAAPWNHANEYLKQDQRQALALVI